MLFTGKEEPAAREEPPVKAQLVTIKMIYTKLFQCPLYCISSFIGIAVSLKSLLILFFYLCYMCPGRLHPSAAE